MTAISAGEHHELIARRHRVPLLEVGAGSRGHTRNDTAVLDDYPRHDGCTGTWGSLLTPWPHRPADGAAVMVGLVAALSLWRRW